MYIYWFILSIKILHQDYQLKSNMKKSIGLNGIRQIKCLMQFAVMFLFAVLFVHQPVTNAQSIYINEIVASNQELLNDEDGDFSDWVELYNYGSVPVNLNGWGLTDDAANTFKWLFPSITLQPGEYLIVWASGKDRRPGQNDLIQGFRQEVYRNISGTSVDNLINNSNYPANPSYQRIITDYFEALSNVEDNYGQRLHGLLKAPASGNYTFWIASDDNSHLYLSSNSLPGNAVKIAEVKNFTGSREWTKYPEQKSGTVSLVAGQYYYIMALMKEGTGSDNLAVRWQLPDGTIQTPLPASNLFLNDSELHTNFSISAQGEPIILTRPDGVEVHRIPEAVLTANVSYGIKPGETGFFYFEKPTPGSANTGSGYNEIINSVPDFSHTGGFYTSDFLLTLSSADPSMSVIYTLDGSEPEISNIGGTTYTYRNQYPAGPSLNRQLRSFNYTGPIPVSDRSSSPYQLAAINTKFTSSTHLPNSNIQKGTVVRAKLVKPNTLSQRSVTHTYFVSPQGYKRYSLPVISIVTNENNLFDYEKGIYVAGLVADTWRVQNPTIAWNDGRPANYNQRGSDWEKDGHLEVFSPSEQTRFAQPVGLRIHGGWSRAHYFKSFRLYARTNSGDGTWFNYPFFGALPQKGDGMGNVSSFRRIILRNSGNDYDRTLFRDALMQDLVKHLPLGTQAYQPAVHFINGEYWGIINIRERFDEYYMLSHYGVEPHEVVILEEGEAVDVGLVEDRKHFLDVVTYAESNDLTNKTHYEYVKSRIDVENLAHYYAAQIYFYNTDWPQNNYNIWRKKTGAYNLSGPYGHDGRWRWLLFDTDFGMNLYSSTNHMNNGLSRVLDSANDRSSRLFKRLLLNQEFRVLFINTVSDQLNSCFLPFFINSRIDAFNAVISGSRPEHWQRWRSGTDEGSAMKTFATQRPTYMIQHVQSAFGLSGTSNLSIYRRGGEGFVKVNSLVINNQTPGISNPSNPFPWVGSYFRGVSLTISAINIPGYKFSHWEGLEGIDKLQPTINITLGSNVSVTAVFKEAPVISSIHYWHFNNLPSGILNNLNADFSQTTKPGLLIYTGSGDGYMDRVSEGTDINARNQDAALALRARNPSDTRAVELNLPTTGFENVILKYATNRTANGAEYQNVYYRTSKTGNWVLFKENILVTTTFQLVDVDFSSVQDADNNPEFQVRITFAGNNASGASGNNRFDNITLEGYVNTTNVNGIKPRVNVDIVPNPAESEFTVYSEKIIQSIHLLNLEGTVLLKRNIGGFSAKVELPAVPPGVYIVSVRTAEGNNLQKLIVK